MINKDFLNFTKKIANIMQKKTLVKKTNSLSPNSSTVVFNNYQIRKIDSKYISLFWEKYSSKKIKLFVENRERKNKSTFISEYNKNMKIFPLAPNILCTVRLIENVYLPEYKQRYSNLKKIISKTKFHFSELVLVDILDIKKISKEKSAILERIFPSISIIDLKQSFTADNKLYSYNRYSKLFLDTISKNNINVESLLKDLDKAFTEIKSNLHLDDNADVSQSNTIILSYNPEKGTFRFGLIDFFGPLSRSFEHNY